MSPLPLGLALPAPGAEAALVAAQRLVAVAVLLDALEVLACRADYGPRGVFRADLLRTHRAWGGSALTARLVDRLFAAETFLALAAGQAAAAVVLIAAPAGAPALAALLLALAGRLVMNLRTAYGMDGSDQMIVLVLAALVLARAGGAVEGVATACLLFLAAQVVTAYLTAGVAKLVSPVWRSGEALPAILRTASYGTEPAALWLAARPRVGRALARSVIALECGLPFAVLAGVPGAWAFVVGGTLFHVGVAVLMGLNAFLWAFVATFPAVLYAAALLERAPAALGGHAGVAAAVGVVLLGYGALLGRVLGSTAVDTLVEVEEGPGAAGEPAADGASRGDALAAPSAAPGAP